MMVMDYKTLIRLLIGCLAVFGAARLYFRENPESGVFTRKTLHVFSPSQFWRRDGKDEPTMLHVNPSLQKKIKKPRNYKNIKKTKLRVPGSLKTKVRLYTGPLNVVHLDLKGAAPKVTYFQKLFPLISSLGANGILMEYEDMFPYEGKLDILRSPFSYSEDDIEEIKSLANLYNLELIPLVQVFGHLEFVLKHGQFFDLREVYDFPNSLNPLHPESLQLIEEMLTQVLMKHPETKWFHIGADEVYSLGESEHSKNWMKQNNRSEGNLFLNHVTKVCHFLTELCPGIKPIFWEDMLRKLDPDLIIESGLPSIASPVIWNYGAEINLSQIGQLLSNYQKAGFQNVWFASAFKGASGVDQRWTPLNLHLQNHLSWIKVMASMSKYPSIKLDGIALTGWQRYEHHTVLCELLPVAIPSLAICLNTLKYGSFNRTAENEVENLLGCKVDLNANSCNGNASFPGSEVYKMVKKIHNELQQSLEKINQNYFVRGSFGPYQRKYNFANPRNIRYFLGTLTDLMKMWDPFMETFKKEMMAIYFSNSVEEWMEENVNQHMDKLRSLNEDANRIIKFKGQERSLNQINYLTK
ncbi:beta-N-acetylhexosaminidase isoform X2 [Tachysurus fulvidraco]|uniref:beta-N-acetylhexosaminidase isoform X2 n=1 Tax=Tachysurus fulvidraco TaxID=1234273 RepID=UPI001FEF427D|nr:beta-N-acetylhexosaminidase isoform X2 [Tachysurus fulvidraco]